MIKIQRPSREESRQNFLRLSREAREDLISGKASQIALSQIVGAECYVALYSDDPLESREHFRKAAEASRDLFRIAWEHRDNFKKGKITGDNGSCTASGSAIEGMHAALAAGDLALARDIAEHSGFRDDKWFFTGRGVAYANALRSFIITGDFSGFSKVPPEDKWLGWYVFAKLFLTAQDNLSQAIADLETLDRKFERSRLKNDLVFRVVLASFRSWLNSQLRS